MTEDIQRTLEERECPTCGHDAADMKRRLDDLVIAAANHWGAGSEQHNLIRDVADAVLRHRRRPPLSYHRKAE